MISRGLLGRGLICLTFVQTLASPAAHAWESLISGSRYTSARASALGGAFLPLGDDGPAALFFNPAAVGKIRAVHAEPMNMALQGNGGFTDSLGLNSYKTFSLSDNLAQLRAAPGSYQGGAAQIVPSFYGKGFALGLLLSDDVAATSDADGNVRYRSRFQFIPAAAIGARLAGGIVRVGYSVQWVHKSEGDISVPAGSATSFNEGLLTGSGLSHTIGMALTLPIAYLPQLDLVGRNLANTAFTGPALLSMTSDSAGSPATEQMTFDASFSLQPKIDSGVFANMVLQLKDMTNRSGIAPFGRLCGGMEIAIKDSVFLRVGWGEGYPAAGIGFKMKKGEFGMSWFSEEIGTYYQAQRDIRFIFQYQMRVF